MRGEKILEVLPAVVLVKNHGPTDVLSNDRQTQMGSSWS